MDDDNIEWVVHYLSHTLDALNKLRPYLRWATFEILTDHKPLKSLFQSEIANTKLQRWAVQIAEFGGPIRYKAGKDNARADMLSRARLPTTTSVCMVEWELPLKFDKINKQKLIAAQQEEFSDCSDSAEYTLADGVEKLYFI